MPLLSLPLTFNNSFWSQDYRKGLETVYAKLSQGVEENTEIVAFIRARVNVERTLANSLLGTQLSSPSGSGFGADDGATLLVAFRGLQAESRKQGEAHRGIAQELDNLVADPFEEWANKHAARVVESKRTLIDGWLRIYEDGVREVEKIKQSYISKRQQADDAEDDIKFAPTDEVHGKFTVPLPKAPRHPDTVSERITQGPFGRKSQSSPLPSSLSSLAEEVSGPNKGEGVDSDQQSISDAETIRPASPPPKKLDKGKGKAIDPPLPASLKIPQSQASLDVPEGSQVTLAGIPFVGDALPELLKRARSQLPLRPIRIPILGEYEDTFTGADFTKWLKDNVPAFEGNIEHAEAAARDLTERDNLLRRIGDLGNKFENHPAVIYQFRSKAFEPLPGLLPDQNKDDYVLTPVPQSPLAPSFVQRSNTLTGFISKRLNNTSVPAHVKFRTEADAADARYRNAVHTLDRQRLSLEDRVEGTLKLWNRWELDRLRAVQTVLLQYHGSLSNIPKAFGSSLDMSSNLISSFQPEADLMAVIERYRTGPFRPSPPVYKAHGSDAIDRVFGMELRRWAGETALNAGGLQKEGIPPIITSLLGALTTAYQKLPDNNERRKAWIYDVPLPSQHTLREAINALPIDDVIPQNRLDQYDAPVLASTLKLWLLELEVPICLWDGWDEIRNMYPSVGADSSLDHSIVDDVRLALVRFPMVHLLVLDALIKHLNELTKNTEEGTEPADMYRNKLALSLGRAILRPRIESHLSIQDKHPTVFFIDLLTHYHEVLPRAIQEKRRHSAGRKIPLRKRTAPVDMRVHRSNASGQFDLSRLIVQADPSRLRSRSPGPEGGVPRPLSLTASLPQQARNPSPPRSSPPQVFSSPQAFSPPVDPHRQLNFSNAPSIPHFKEPEPETDDVPSTSSVTVISPAPNSQAFTTPPTAPITLPTPELTPQPTPPDEVAVDKSIPAPFQENLRFASPAPEPEAPTSAPVLGGSTPPLTEASASPPPEYSATVSVPAPPPDPTPSRTSTIPSMTANFTPVGRRGSTASGGTSSSRSTSPVKSPNGRVAAARASLQRNSSVNDPPGGPGGPRGPRGPRVNRGGARGAVSPVGGSKGAGGDSNTRTSMSPSRSSSPSVERNVNPSRGTPLRTPSTLKKQRPSSLTGKRLATRSMASGSEDETLGKHD